MSKSLKSIPVADRDRVALERSKGAIRGLGYWGAVDYLAKKKSSS